MVEEVDKVDNKRPDRYAVISQLLDEWIPTFGDWFSSEDSWRHITGQGVILSSQGKKDVAVKLARDADKGILRRRGKKFKAIDKSTIKISNPFNAKGTGKINLKFPAPFGFNDVININQGDVIVFGGESNQGKSTLAYNILGDNMDAYPCFLISTEATEIKFKKRFNTMTWVEPLKPNGDAKFQYAFMDGDNYDEVIEPDMINIIDWVGLRENYYNIENVIRDIKVRLNKGIAVLVLQKKEGQDTPVGGEFAYRRADVCFVISKGMLKVIKVKDWNPPNPNYKTFKFNITDNECHFENIREVIKCDKCKGFGKNFGKECQTCVGSGYRDKEDWAHDVPFTV